MENKIIKAIRLFAIVSICIALVFSIIISQDEHHLETCHEDNCKICNMIHIAQIIINISFGIIILCLAIGFLIYFILSRLHKNIIIFVQSSLVFQKVQLNE